MGISWLLKKKKQKSILEDKLRFLKKKQIVCPAIRTNRKILNGNLMAISVDFKKKIFF